MASLASAAQQQSGLPGFTLPLNYVPPGWLNPFRTRLLYPHALQETEESTKVYREILMMRVMNTITEKQDWNKKIFNEEIISKWREEILNSGQDISPKMMDYIVKELQWKSKLIETDGFITAFDKGVVKSDTAVPEELRKALADAVAPLEDVPDDQKDYHPGSDQKVIDLVHPSLFPLIYGHTRILRNELVTLENCIGTTGQGELLPAFSESSDERWMPGVERDFYSRKFQWLPCNVELSATESAEPECRIVSYINNLHPAKHRTLYGVIEKIISCAIPLWNRSLAGEGSMNRIMYEVVEYDEESLGPPPEQEPNEPEDDFSGTLLGLGIIC
ncbi:hypothetical protein N7454_004252 [Penicillium verhagenii]|nr:hypothetical protein N7454_004252 [Penicillium verhagenii]